MKKLVIFDLDGTLLNTLKDLNTSVNFALKLKGYPEVSLEHTRKAIGNGVATLIKRSIPNNIDDENYLDTLKLFRQHYCNNFCVKTTPYEGIKELAIKLKNKGFLLGICTNKLQSVAELLINKFFTNIFDFIVGDSKEVQKKPAPDMIYKVLNDSKIKLEDAIYIGDTNVDEETALNSKIDYVLITYGYRTLEELNVQCPNAIKKDSPEEIFEYLIK